MSLWTWAALPFFESFHSAAHAFVHRSLPESTEVRALPARQLRQTQLVGSQIRQLRKEHRLTQNELATRIGVQQSDLSRMEKGEYRVSLDTLFKILGEFDLGIGEFFGEDPTANTTADDMSLLRQLRSLPQEDQKEIEEFVGFKRSRHLANSAQKRSEA